jgi:hypothetical protein
MTPQKNHSVGEQPTNPIITDKWVYCISNIQREYPVEDDGLIHWSYDIDEQIPIVEYTKRNLLQTQQDNLDRDEMIADILGGIV